MYNTGLDIVIILTISNYSANSITEWLHRWKKI